VPVVETVLIYVLIPAAIYGVIALLTLLPKSTRVTRYRPGQPWTYEPVWWSAAGAVDRQQESAPAAEPVRTARGGARGNW
jgi:hypothetical protein